MDKLTAIRNEMRTKHLAEEQGVLAALADGSNISLDLRNDISIRAAQLVRDIRGDDKPALLEVFLAEYGLSTDEGVALMCLAEALMRVPDVATIDDLIEDKIAPSAWEDHRGQSNSLLVNASTWGLMLTGKVLSEQSETGLVSVLHGMVKRLGEPVIRTAVIRAMKELGSQFVLGQTIEEALKRGKESESKGFTYSYDMLGEAALTAKDATKFFDAYKDSILKLTPECKSDKVAENPGISIKLSALHPRYEVGKKERVLDELGASVLELCLLAKDANMGLNIDAEEADRLELSLDVIEKVFADERLSGWEGFGVVVQAYSKRCAQVIDWLYTLAEQYDRKIMIRLVKGAYWDSEIKLAQVEGLKSFPLYTRKSASDCSYIYNAEKLLGYADRIYPQFATHNAHSVAAILEMAKEGVAFEFQRLHGMGETLHRQVREKEGTHCRIYAPVGPHRDLLAYLVRRLLENGANSSFVNQIVDENTPPEVIAKDPFVAVVDDYAKDNAAIAMPLELFGDERKNSIGWDLHNEDDIVEFTEARGKFKDQKWSVGPLASIAQEGGEIATVTNPADPSDVVGQVEQTTAETVEAALSGAKNWADSTVSDRAFILNKAADLYEENFGELFAILCREAGKTPNDAIGELREAVDFLRYYAVQAEKVADQQARGVFVCVSPWNFPLAIFTGQIVAALAAGNGVLAKPAEQTPIIAAIAVKLMHEAGVPKNVLQLLPGRGAIVGAKLVSDPRINGVCFTGSTATAQNINRSMAENVNPTAPLIAETGGLNAMIVDSTALPEQAVKDIVASAFQSAGQRCSALRVLYVQEDIADSLLEMLYGAMDEQTLGMPWDLTTDIGPVIDQTAYDKISGYVEHAKANGRLLKQMDVPEQGTFVGPAVIRVNGISDLKEEIFGPVLHVATFKAWQLPNILDDINASGFGLTFGLHTRIDDRVKYVTSQLNVGNMYVNRNQIGAIVGCQPFGGEGLSGTGPKAGGPEYIKRFADDASYKAQALVEGTHVAARDVQIVLNNVESSKRNLLSKTQMSGPTGESNVLYTYSRGTVLCLGPTLEAAQKQAEIARSQKCAAVIVAPGATGENAVDGILSRSDLGSLSGFDGVALWSTEDDLRLVRQALAVRDGAILPLMAEENMAERCVLERHICIDTTAAGGNTTLLASSS